MTYPPYRPKVRPSLPIRIPSSCKSIDDVATWLAKRLGVTELHIEVIDRDWGVASVYEVDGVDLEYIGRLDDDTFRKES